MLTSNRSYWSYTFQYLINFVQTNQCVYVSVVSSVAFNVLLVHFNKSKENAFIHFRFTLFHCRFRIERIAEKSTIKRNHLGRSIIFNSIHSKAFAVLFINCHCVHAKRSQTNKMLKFIGAFFFLSFLSDAILSIVKPQFILYFWRLRITEQYSRFLLLLLHSIWFSYMALVPSIEALETYKNGTKNCTRQ